MNRTPGRVVAGRIVGGAFVAVLILIILSWVLWPMFSIAGRLAGCS